MMQRMYRFKETSFFLILAFLTFAMLVTLTPLQMLVERSSMIFVHRFLSLSNRSEGTTNASLEHGLVHAFRSPYIVETYAHGDATPAPGIRQPKNLSIHEPTKNNLSDRTMNTSLEHGVVHAFRSPYTLEEPDGGATPVPGIRQIKTISIYEAHRNMWFRSTATETGTFQSCPYPECKLDVKGKETDKADLMLFVCNGPYAPPRHRPSGQLWAAVCLESGQNWGFPNYDLWRNVFNLTINYRLDADIFYPYFQMAWVDPSALMTQQQYVTIAEKKNKTAVWFVSNCSPARLKFVKEMQKYIDIDIYGRCGRSGCPRLEGKENCQDLLNTTYKFYLAFENSHCKDYVTEKFSRSFKERTQIIPVTKGGADYDKYFPRDTFVNGERFQTAKELSLYLKELAADVPRYAKMLEEKDKLSILPRKSVIWCRICQALHTITKKHRVYDDIGSWSRNGTCQNSGYKL